jgi:hypothetical protein
MSNCRAVARVRVNAETASASDKRRRPDSCAASAPLLTAGTLNKSGLIRTIRPEKTLTISELEKLVGSAGKLSRSRQTVGGQVWLSYTETWRVGAAPYRLLMVDGNVPLSSAPTQEVDGKRFYCGR